MRKFFFLTRLGRVAVLAAAFCVLLPGVGTVAAQTSTGTTTRTAPAEAAVKPIPGFDQQSMDLTSDPCADFYKFACGNFAKNHPIPSDLPRFDEFTNLYEFNTGALHDILEKAAAKTSGRSANEQKIGDYYAACMNTGLIESQGIAPMQPWLKEIDGLKNKSQLSKLVGELQRFGINIFFGYGEQQDFKDASLQIASADQGGLGLPDKDYYLRTGAKDITIRKQYVDHMTKMMVLLGESQETAAAHANAILAMETEMAKASMGKVERRDPDKVYHMESMDKFAASIPVINLAVFSEATHAPVVKELNVATPDYFPALNKVIESTSLDTLKAYMKYELATSLATRLPKKFDDENFDFYSHTLFGVPVQQARWKRCSNATDGALGEALGQVYVSQYFAGDSKAYMLKMVHGIESAMGEDLSQLTWMSDATKKRAEEKLHEVANKIGYPDKWRDYSTLTVKANDPVGDVVRARIFENDREFAKIGKPVDHGEWDMSPPTVNAYYDPSMNDINFPAGILQPPFYDHKEDDAVNYGHIGAVIGHELTHGFDDEGRKFDGKGNLSDWWTAEDTTKFNEREDCLVKEYDGFVAVDDLHVNGKLTLGENTADNGGLLLAYMSYMQHAKDAHIDLTKKVDGFTPEQRLYIGFAQNWCSNARDEYIRYQVQTDPHSPEHFRANGVLVNQPAFGKVFGCKVGTPMVPEKSCRVW